MGLSLSRASMGVVGMQVSLEEPRSRISAPRDPAPACGGIRTEHAQSTSGPVTPCPRVYLGSLGLGQQAVPWPLAG